MLGSFGISELAFDVWNIGNLIPISGKFKDAVFFLFGSLNSDCYLDGSS